ncbi:MAG: ABC transporter substrate-binding protein, partial [Victivallaceae bacterium]|nr:ABC transporter substrate-binding protein [Victivallaceae bacterium]
LLGSFDVTYCDYFGICIFSHTIRLYVNMELFRNACGADARPPETVTEWVAACSKINEYGNRIGKPLIPIGGRGFDKGTLAMLLSNYFSQLNADLPERCSRYGGRNIYNADLFGQMRRGDIAPRRLFAAYALIAELGRYFAPGFSSIDLEQTKYLFSSGNVAFFIDGTYNAWSMVNNAPFEVEIVRLPALDREHRLGNDSIGLTAETRVDGYSGKFGIAKAGRNFDIALDFLQYITSYRVNRMTMVDYCKWMSPLKQVAYSGMMEKLQPVTGAEYPAIPIPFHMGAYSTRKSLQWLESCIVNREPDPAEYMRTAFTGDRENMIDELQENRLSCQRTMWDLAATASAMRTGLLAAPGPGVNRRRLADRADIAAEAAMSIYRAGRANLDAADELAKTPEEP